MDGDLFDAARRVAALADERSAASEEARTLDRDVVDALREADLLRLCVPSAYGGPEVDPVSLVDVLASIAAGDGAAGWCSMIASTSGAMAAFMDPDAAAEIYGNPSVVTGGTYAPMGVAVPVADGDGWEVTGRWGWGSGIRHCDWVMGGTRVEGNPGPTMMFFPAADMIVHDTWFSSGLRGTGSNEFSVERCRVPARFGLRASPFRPVVDSALGRFPTFGLLATGVAAVCLGIGRRAVDELVALAKEKTPQFAGKRLGENQLVQVDIAEADAMVSASRAFLLEQVAQVWGLAARDADISVDARARLRLAAAHAAAGAASAVDRCYNAGGGSSVFMASPLQRCWRDVHTATQHIMVSRRLLDAFGRNRLGLPLDSAML